VPLPKFEEQEEKKEQAAVPEKAPEQKPAPATEKAAPAAEPAKTKAVKTLFEYKGPGRSVTMAGSFSVWREIKMSRKNGGWRAEVYILPGTYTYHFTVDGKKTADPGKPKAPTGDSIVTVE
jgi:1,4-alpha-glucan branching enzyme